MKIKKYITIMVTALVTGCGFYATLSAHQGTRDSSFFNNKAGIPNSGNVLYPNNGPESPHTSFPVQTTDPGPLTPGTNGNMVDTIPHFKR